MDEPVYSTKMGIDGGKTVALERKTMYSLFRRSVNAPQH
jgi:hypothetical protein